VYSLEEEEEELSFSDEEACSLETSLTLGSTLVFSFSLTHEGKRAPVDKSMLSNISLFFIKTSFKWAYCNTLLKKGNLYFKRKAEIFI